MKDDLFKKHHQRFLFWDIAVLVSCLAFLIYSLIRHVTLWPTYVVIFILFLLAFLLQVLAPKRMSYNKRRTFFTISSMIFLVTLLYYILNTSVYLVRISSLIPFSLIPTFHFVFLDIFINLFIINLAFLIMMRRDKAFLENSVNKSEIETPTNKK